ncbi:MAG TPA: class I SAM-dependent methyltransferase [Candidatus Wallbacteria bacterium]|nr:class I SAM-dependent methyltransferase [Candidatus Wallbacteria bacterium]
MTFISPVDSKETASFFDAMAEKWDTICFHDPAVITRMMELTGISDERGPDGKIKILDAGCGTGIMIPFISHFTAGTDIELDAIDLSEKMIATARNKLSAYKNVNFMTADILDENSAFSKKSGGKYDAVFLYSVFPHFNDYADAALKINRLLKPDGKMIIMHSESRETLNRMHSSQDAVADAMLPPAKELSEIFIENNFKIKYTLDTDYCYFILAQKN